NFSRRLNNEKLSETTR
ncbi:hypothetical protein E2320_018506, partial [Naja naja]